MKKRLCHLTALLLNAVMLFAMAGMPVGAETSASTEVDANALIKSYGFTCNSYEEADGSNPDVASAEIAQENGNRYLKLVFGESESYPKLFFPVSLDMSNYTVRIDLIVVSEETNKLCSLIYGTSGGDNGQIGFRLGAYTKGKTWANIPLSGMATVSDALYFGASDGDGDADDALKNISNGLGAVHRFEVTVKADSVGDVPAITAAVDGIPIECSNHKPLSASRIGISGWKTSAFGIDNIYVKNNATGEVVYEEDFETCVKYDDISPYRAADAYTAPTKQRMVFAGWYADRACTVPIGRDVTDGSAYAKYVPEQVLRVKAQVGKDVTTESTATGVRLVTTVDSLNYAQVGFRMSYNGGDIVERMTSTVYETILSLGEACKPTVFSEESQYFATLGISDVPLDGNTIRVTPIWTTLDGTTVGGATSDLSADTLALLNGMSRYTIVYAQDAPTHIKNAAQALKTNLEAYTGGQEIAITSDSAAQTEYEILVGDTNRQASVTEEALFYYDFLIRTVGNQIAINGGGSFAVETATEKLLAQLINGKLEERYLYRFDTSLLNPLADDQSSFVPAWKDMISVPDWMTDFDEKLYALTNPSGRPMCVSHRGDVINYPEDSLEGILSAALLGADVIEMDLVLTKDNVLVLCHDTTLTKTTNVGEFVGKNGLPNSVKVSDWTYAELQQLSLLDRAGNLTPYKMPSYYEILKVLRGRCFLAIDKKVDGYSTEDILEMETLTDSLELSIYSMFLSSGSGPAQGNSWSYMSNYSKAHPELTRFAAIIKSLDSYMASGGNIRRRGWITGKATTDPSIEASFDVYKNAYEGGLNLIYTNNIPLMSQFIATYQPDR